MISYFLTRPTQRKLLMSLMLTVVILAAVGLMSPSNSQSIISRMVGVWAICTVNVTDCIKIKVHRCTEDGDTALCRVSLP